jgi:hypothetical protein
MITLNEKIIFSLENQLKLKGSNLKKKNLTNKKKKE